MEIDVTNLDSVSRRTIQAYPVRRSTPIDLPRPMPAPAPQPRPLSMRCAGCGAPLNFTSLCSYCKSPNPWTSR